MTIRGMAMRWIKPLLVAVLLAVAPARAATVWLDVPGTYELTGAQLFQLRSELPPELNESLRSIRNQSFADESAFRAALGDLLLTDELRAAWLDRLVGLAAAGGGAIGIETREGDLLTITVAGSDRALDDVPFTAQSWLPALPPETTETGFTATLDGACLAVGRDVVLFRLCQPSIGSGEKSVRLETEAQHIVGLGQEFQVPGETTAERNGFLRAGSNLMGGFNGGANGNTLFPIAYFDLPENPFALILDNRHPQQWDFRDRPASLTVKGGDLRLRVLAGSSLADIRRQFMALSGHPPVPPKSMFGLWISEYGYENWAELDGKIETLRAAGFPLSGAVLDLYWFGGIKPNSTTSAMGGLNWDRVNFPDPEDKVARYAAEGLGVMLIEESYISSGLPEHARLAELGGLAHDNAGAPVVTNPAGNWWGRGGMIDWLATDATAAWHDWKRQPLIDMGIAGHWIDLGEPEMVAPGFRYGPDNLTDPQVRNSYNLLWAESIREGYRRNAPEKRPFIMSRSGGMGLQALGGAMWSGDTGGDFGSLAAQMPQQQHMMWSGMDYYGSDIGGFHRSAMGIYPGTHKDLTDELYTQWFAYASLFEVPVRPHTENLCNCKETAPDRIGDVASNLASIRLRYALEPYYYALAHRAWREGEPVFPSLDYHYPDAAAKGLGHVKMIGSELVAAAVSEPGATEVQVYLPAGTWYDWRSTKPLTSAGQHVTIPLYASGRLELPLFARDGAIVPMAGGHLRLFGSAPNSFSWIDDDGTSTAYQRGEFDHLTIDLDGAAATLTRMRGDIAVGSVAWTRAAPVAEVRVDGNAVPFTQEGTTVSVALPAFERQLTIELR
jgi:alpha-glucosidase (family GH31 glycosyl hydrolase)